MDDLVAIVLVRPLDNHVHFGVLRYSKSRESVVKVLGHSGESRSKANLFLLAVVAVCSKVGQILIVRGEIPQQTT
jgi:hypothetical protein